MRRSLLLTLSILFAAPSFAAQIVVMDIEAKGGVKKELAEGLTPVLHAALSDVEGMVVISQDDVLALLELEANKALMGCSKESCMTEIAGSMGAELMARSTISKVGKDFVVSLSLIDVNRAKPVLRATGKARGGDEMAPSAIEDAVHNTFKKQLPRDLQGPASMSRRGFSAALAGLHQVAMDKRKSPADSRKRVVLDLVNTELDYDAEPKLRMLDQAIRGGQYDARMAALSSKNKKMFEHYMGVRAFYSALWHDMGRVKEIRERARAEGRQPTPRALRFEKPDPLDRPDPADVKSYVRAVSTPRKIVAAALAALKSNKPKAFATQWHKDKERNALSSFESLRRNLTQYKRKYDLVPQHALLPDQLESGIRTLKDKEGKEMVVYLRTYKKGEINGTDTVRLKKDGKKWRISSW
jgi:hypothetical protein